MKTKPHETINWMDRLREEHLEWYLTAFVGKYPSKEEDEDWWLDKLHSQRLKDLEEIEKLKDLKNYTDPTTNRIRGIRNGVLNDVIELLTNRIRK